MKEPSIIEQKAYRDTWGKGLDSYLKWFYETVVLLRELLTDDGSLYVHCDWRLSANIRLVLDEVFGYDNFSNEIIWQSAVGDTSSKNRKFIKSHDSIFSYRKGDTAIWNDVYQQYSSNALTIYKFSDARGKYQLGPCDNPGGGGYVYTLGYGEKAPSRGYSMPKETALNWIEDGTLVVEAGKVPLRKWYMNDNGVRCKDIWTDIGKERALLYPTQKPEALLERVIKASSNPGDLVLDCFCGSGTTAAVAEKLGRRWITCDLGRFAIHTARKRLLSIDNVKPFTVQNLGKYERQQWQTAEFGEGAEDKTRDYREFMLKLYRAQPIQGYVWLHGLKAGRMVYVGTVDSPVSVGDVQQVAAEFKRSRGTGQDAPTQNGVDILGWDFAFELNEVSKQQAAQAGIDVRFLRIPREVLEKKAVEQGDIKFFELAALKVEVKESGKGVTLALADFIMPLDDVPQDVQKAITHWEQWVDYWAIDWDNKGDTFHNEWQSYRTRKDKTLIKQQAHAYPEPGTYKIVVKVIDILGNDTTKTLAVTIA